MDQDAIQFTRENGHAVLHTGFLLARPLDTVFPFFADAANLERITPPSLRFRILTPMPVEMTEGLLIDYRIRLMGVPMPWRSRIAVWEPPHRFVDEQQRGPYRKWWHEHLFEERDGRTLVTDRVTYAVPAGALVDRLFVRRQLRHIFEFRRAALVELLDGDR